MKNRLIIHRCMLLLCLFSLNLISSAQQAEIAASQPTEPAITSITAGFLGAVIYPGFTASIERPYAQTSLSIAKAKRQKSLQKHKLMSYQFAMYHQPTYHTNYYAQAEWLHRRQKPSGFFIDGGIGAGVSRTVLDGATYTVSSSGDIEKQALAGNWYALLSASGSIGYGGFSALPVHVFIKHQWNIFFPYNALFTLRPTFAICVRYGLHNFWANDIEYKQAEKQRRSFKKTLKQAAP